MDLSEFPEDLAEAITELMKRRSAEGDTADSVDGLLKGYACLEALFQTRTGPRPDKVEQYTNAVFTNDADHNRTEIRNRLKAAAGWARGELTRREFLEGQRSWRERFEQQYQDHFAYVIDDDNFQRAKELSAQLLNAIEECTAFKAGHRSRLVRRVTELIADLHPRMSSLDKLTGVTLDAIAHAQYIEDEASRLKIVGLSKKLLRVGLAVFGANAALPSGDEPLLLATSEEAEEVPASPTA
ncbi:MAG: hypothetical protein ACF8LL_02080 [Phycisphaerales bacterium]